MLENRISGKILGGHWGKIVSMYLYLACLFATTICHYCGQTFAAEEKRFDFSVTNYVHLVANAIGIDRDDKFKRYALWRNLDRILKDADDHILESPFEKERILEVIKSIFIQ